MGKNRRDLKKQRRSETQKSHCAVLIFFLEKPRFHGNVKAAAAQPIPALGIEMFPGAPSFAADTFAFKIAPSQVSGPVPL